MHSKQSFPKLAPFALSLTLFASGCSPSTEVPPHPVLPDMPATTAAECPEPGVASDAYVALTETRLALAACRRKHHDAVAFYLDVKGRIQ